MPDGRVDGPSPAVGKPLRRDAERNRRLIVSAAREVFAEHGIAAGLNDVARHAGVGVGTVYRRFPHKDALVEEALQDQLVALVAVLDEGLRADSAWDGLSWVVRRAVEMNIADRGLRDVAFRSGRGTTYVDVFRDRLAPRLERLLSRARLEGAVRPGVTASDLVLIMLMITEFAHRSRDVQQNAYSRYLDLMLQAVRAVGDGPAPLAVQISDVDARAIAAHWTSSMHPTGGADLDSAPTA